MISDVKIEVFEESHCVVNGKVYFGGSKVHKLARSILVLIEKVRGLQ